MPASPDTTMAWPDPSAVNCQRSRSNSSSRSRPTHATCVFPSTRIARHRSVREGPAKAPRSRDDLSGVACRVAGIRIAPPPVARASCDHERAGRCKLLDAGCEVRRLPVTVTCARRPRPIRSPITADRLRCRSARIRFSRRGRDGANLGDDVSTPSRTDRTFGFALVGVGIPEIGKNGVALILRDETFKAANCFGADLLVSERMSTQIFGIEPLGHLGRADQIAEHHRHLPPFGLSAPGVAAAGASANGDIGLGRPAKPVMPALIFCGGQARGPDAPTPLR